MEDTQEKVVDPNLNDFLNKDLPTNTARAPNLAGEEFDTVENEPLKSSTEERIYHYLNKGVNHEEAQILMDVIERIKGMTEAEGQKLLKALQFKNRDMVDKELVSFFQKEIVKIFINPLDTKRRKAAKKDKYIHGCICDSLTDLLGKLGSFSGLIVFGVYVIASWRTTGTGNILNHEEKKNNSEGEESNKNVE